ncbi:MAG TPA: protein-disulfide reductase DsbD domain-containing protein [Alphaproteobacteria bacterium]|nr:protein-disulfide reductase DsbD domain-containing protein [Alphaproteobacteria bacterium]
MPFKAKIALLGALVAILAVGAAKADDPAASPWAETDQSRVRLLAATTATGATGTLRLGLEFQLASGWKTYWRAPGDAGFPPRADWDGSSNVVDVAMRWPAPARFELFGLDTFGYGDQVVFPLDVRVARPGEPVKLAAKVDYLICEKICIPYTAELNLTLPAGAANPSPHAHLIDRFNARVPGDGGGAGLAIERASWSGGKDPAIVVGSRAMTPFVAPDVYVEGPDGWSFGRAEARLSDGGARAILRLPLRAGGKESLAGREVRLTLVDGDRSAERTLVLGGEAAAAGSESGSLLAILGLALLGGLILNLMPCVLPVLSLKLLGVVSHGGAARGAIRASFVASAAGILTAFAVLAAALIAFKSAGLAIGWGIQFQQPAFLVFMALVVTLFAANLWGWFEIRLPDPLADAAAVAGTPRLRRPSLGGAFVTGALATLLATPCSAPFLGTAVGFALARGPFEIFAVFATLGLGLALPYLVVAAFPALAQMMPRPGVWIVWLRYALGFALAGTAAWLLSILAAQIEPAGMVVLSALLLAVLLVLWRGQGGRLAAMRLPALAIIAIIAFVVPGRFEAASSRGIASTSDLPGAWRAFEHTDIAALVGEGRVVFVDVTADWCITCQVNKSLVLARGPVAARLADGAVIPVRADWTRPDDRIAMYLASFGRYGIPFYAVYGPGAPDGLVLPEVLTPEAVLGAFEKAAGPAQKTAAG